VLWGKTFALSIDIPDNDVMPRLTHFRLHLLPYIFGLKGERGVLSLQTEQTKLYR
jgi:hypothetical protein